MRFASLRRVVPLASLVALLVATGAWSEPASRGLAARQLTIYHYWDWGWGELTYGQSYATTLTVNNLCDSDQPVNFAVSDPFHTQEQERDGKKVKVRYWLDSMFINGKEQTGSIPQDQKSPVSARAMMSIPKAGCNAAGSPDGGREPTTCSTTVPPGATIFDVTIVTPAPPDPKTIPRGTDPLTVYQDIAGKLLITTKGFPPVCLPSQEEYYPGGHVHLNPTLEGGPRCRDWWDREQKPTGLTRDCTKEIRDLALHYLRTTLKPLIEKDPAAWDWLPTEEQILAMAIEPLIEMKKRSRESMRKVPRR